MDKRKQMCYVKTWFTEAGTSNVDIEPWMQAGTALSTTQSLNKSLNVTSHSLVRLCFVQTKCNHHHHWLAGRGTYHHASHRSHGFGGCNQSPRCPKKHNAHTSFGEPAGSVCLSPQRGQAAHAVRCYLLPGIVEQLLPNLKAAWKRIKNGWVRYENSGESYIITLYTFNFMQFCMCDQEAPHSQHTRFQRKQWTTSISTLPAACL